MSQADAGTAPSLTVATNGNGALQVTDASTGENTLMKIHENGNAEFAQGQVYGHIAEVTNSDGTEIVDFDNGNVQKLTLTAAHTNITFTGHKAGASYTIFLIQDDEGNRTADIEETTGGYDIHWQSGVVPVLSTTPGSVDIITFISDGFNLYGAAAYNFQRVPINN